MFNKFEFKNKKVVIMGLGLHGGGLGVAKYLAVRGANILITDTKTKVQLKTSIEKLKRFKNINYQLGGHRLKDFKEAEIVIANPIVRQENKFLQAAQTNGAAIYNDISFFIKLCSAPVIGITGTKGKSTTSSLIYSLLKADKKDVYLGGNIRISPFDFLDKLTAKSLVVLEISSWQCEGLARLKISPKVSVLTNLGVDHLNTYKSLQHYHQSKALIFKYQSKNDYAILNKQDDKSLKLINKIKSKLIFFNTGRKNYFNDKYLYYQYKPLLGVHDVPLIGVHNQSNILAALAVAEIYNIKRSSIKNALTNFKSLDGRLEKVRTFKKVDYINDTTATAPLAVISSLEAIAKPIVLIAGGNDKELNIDSLADYIIAKVKHVFLLPGTATDKLIKIFKKQNFIGYNVVKTMSQAVKKAQNIAQAGETVILSPGATSFGSFINEFDRGDKFKQAVKKLY